MFDSFLPLRLVHSVARRQATTRHILVLRRPRKHNLLLVIITLKPLWRGRIKFLRALRNKEDVVIIKKTHFKSVSWTQTLDF